jgi:hypothetical protein
MKNKKQNILMINKTKQTEVGWGIEKLASLTFDYMAGFISKCEYDQLSDGDFVKLVWMIEKLRHPSNKCTMNELIEEANKHFDGLEGIKEVKNEQRDK